MFKGVHDCENEIFSEKRVKINPVVLRIRLLIHYCRKTSLKRSVLITINHNGVCEGCRVRTRNKVTVEYCRQPGILKVGSEYLDYCMDDYQYNYC